MILWEDLDSLEKVQDILNDESDRIHLIFKHSTRCSLSTLAKTRLERDWDGNGMVFHLLDLIRYRSVSDHVSEVFDVYHESPQMIIIHQGESLHDASHLDISVKELQEVLNYHHLI